MERQGASTILVTGASGFLGKAVLATLLARDDGSTRVLVLLRAPDGEAAARRLWGEVLSGEPFAGLAPVGREGMRREGRLRAVAGDLEAGRLDVAAEPAWGEVDTVIHCAASVSFEEPLDTILALNAFGPVCLLESLRAAGARPHFVHVSTAYAADCRRPAVGEDGPLHSALASLDPEAMLAQAREWRAREGGGGGDERAERRLAERGRRYAVAAGWPDTYALTKALGERLLGERSERTTIVRPTIIESALRDPRPGWVEGIKVADPLILAYAARGLTHLAGDASNLIDIVPVDLVANACVAAALYPPERSRAIAVASSSRNPLAIGELAAHIKTYFRAEPLRRRNGAEIEIGDLRFVSRRQALRRAAARQRIAAAAAMFPPPANRRRLRRNASLAAQVTRMVGIYAPYTELSCAFQDDNARALAAAMSPAEREALNFDPAAIEWGEYLQGIHLPAVRQMAENRGR
ncbi:MAG TPA: SDR family oxidoreductase [Solirubrobacterales bacterium]|nr:SDR family oxidoreductase [Solirubrobacterales bacterium]